MIGQIRIRGALQSHVTLTYRATKPFPPAVIAERLELPVRIEDQSRPWKPACKTRGVRMKADDEEGRSAEAKGKSFVVGIGAHGCVPVAKRTVRIVECTQLRPQCALECNLVVRPHRKHGGERAVVAGQRQIGNERMKVTAKPRSSRSRGKLVVRPKTVTFRVYRSFCTKARIRRIIPDERPEVVMCL